MSASCKHGLNPRFCAECRRTKEAEPLHPDAFRLTSDGIPLILLHLEPDSQSATALLLEGPSAGIATVEQAGLKNIDLVDDLRGREIVEQLHALALSLGYLFRPNWPLTVREQTEEGPSHCYQCRTEVSLEKGLLGCRQCYYYVCQCGRCLCGYTGMNYRGEIFSQYPALPIPRAHRVEYVRVVKLCARLLI